MLFKFRVGKNMRVCQQRKYL